MQKLQDTDIPFAFLVESIYGQTEEKCNIVFPVLLGRSELPSVGLNLFPTAA